MTRRIKAENPDYKPITVGYRVRMEPVPSRCLIEGRVDFFVRSPERDSRRAVTLRCMAGPERLCITGMGKATESAVDEEGETKRSIDLLVRNLPKDALAFLLALRSRLEQEWKKICPLDTSKPVDLSGVLVSYPHERGVPWLREYDEVSLEGLEPESLSSSMF